MLAPPLIPDESTRTLAQLVAKDVWRASELAVSRSTTRATGHAYLDAELPNKGWPRSSLIELLLQQSGIGELQLLEPALAALSKTQRIALVQPPYIPQSMAFKVGGIDTNRLLWITAKSSADALWTTEQILKNGSCGAVIFWQQNVRSESLRRLNLAAQTTDTWFWFMRPMSCASDSSPAPLRLALRPALGGVSVEILKRRGPHCDVPLFIPLADMPAGRQLLDIDHEVIDNSLPALITSRVAAPVLV
ncbi:protein ImuA [Janthinobacterium sp. CG_23.3]|uniref:translesion DNA synthesis-associated protein ImuA n=1 Tax=Janthinobacterium sp. CG_23.3 TaxID=3349634 RepID=UPI0038D4E725